MGEENHPNRKDRLKDILPTGIAASLMESVQRHGQAAAEYIKGYAGIDQQTGQIFHKGLREVSQYNIHPEYAAQNIKQQAGFSAEIAATSRDNAQAILDGSPVRTLRTEDVPGYGSNHPVVFRKPSRGLRCSKLQPIKR